jgi:hypothetical protein
MPRARDRQRDLPRPEELVRRHAGFQSRAAEGAGDVRTELGRRYAGAVEGDAGPKGLPGSEEDARCGASSGRAVGGSAPDGRAAGVFPGRLRMRR